MRSLDYERSQLLSQLPEIDVSSYDGRFGLYVAPRHVGTLLSLCSEADHLETGGILIGKYNKTHELAVVTRVCGPPGDSQRGRSQFWRGLRGLQRLLNHLWRRQEYYLGEWHYHPGGSARPSKVDIEQMKRISESTQYHTPEPILVLIGGTPPLDWEAVAYVFPRGQKLVQLGRLSLELQGSQRPRRWFPEGDA